MQVISDCKQCGNSFGWNLNQVESTPDGGTRPARAPNCPVCGNDVTRTNEGAPRDFHNFAKQDDVAGMEGLVREAIKSGKDIRGVVNKEVSGQSFNPLVVAAIYGSERATEFLLNNGADPKHIPPAMQNAIEWRHPGVVRVLLRPLEAAAAEVDSASAAQVQQTAEKTTNPPDAATAGDFATTPPAATDKIRFRCPKCQHRITTPVQHAGKRGKCPKCGTAVQVPPAAAPPSATSSSAAVGLMGDAGDDLQHVAEFLSSGGIACRQINAPDDGQLIVFIVSASDSPLVSLRSKVAACSQKRVIPLATVVTDVASVDDKELVELLSLDVSQVLELMLPGSDPAQIPVLHDNDAEFEQKLWAAVKRVRSSEKPVAPTSAAMSTATAAVPGSDENQIQALINECVPLIQIHRDHQIKLPAAPKLNVDNAGGIGCLSAVVVAATIALVLWAAFGDVNLSGFGWVLMSIGFWGGLFAGVSLASIRPRAAHKEQMAQHEKACAHAKAELKQQVKPFAKRRELVAAVGGVEKLVDYDVVRSAKARLETKLETLRDRVKLRELAGRLIEEAHAFLAQADPRGESASRAPVPPARGAATPAGAADAAVAPPANETHRIQAVIAEIDPLLQIHRDHQIKLPALPKLNQDKAGTIGCLAGVGLAAVIGAGLWAVFGSVNLSGFGWVLMCAGFIGAFYLAYGVASGNEQEAHGKRVASVEKQRTEAQIELKRRIKPLAARRELVAAVGGVEKLLDYNALLQLKAGLEARLQAIQGANAAASTSTSAISIQQMQIPGLGNVNVLDLRSDREREIERTASKPTDNRKVEAMMNELIKIGRRSNFICLSDDQKKKAREFDEELCHRRAKEIGETLNSLGGMELMQAAYYRVKQAGAGSARSLEHCWNGIGEWRS